MSKKPQPFWLYAVAWLARHNQWIGRVVNRIAINAVVNSARHRPHPLSTAHDYVSWVTLSDRSWSGRHLPPVKKITSAPAEAVLAIFQRPSTQKLSERSTCLFPAFAQYLTDGFIRTRLPGEGESDALRLQNTSNHEIDMCPLYGLTLQQTNALRSLSEKPGEKGRLKSQIINGEEYAPFLCEQGQVKLEFSYLDLPLGFSKLQGTPLEPFIFAFGGDRTNASPQVAMINTLFLREHNRLAREAEEIHPDWDDEHVFQVCRNTIIVIFIKIVVEEYINHISPSIQFRADPAVAWSAKWNRPNWITTEFSLLYRWHPLVPDFMHWGGESIPIRATLMNNELLLAAGLKRAFEEQSAQAAGRLCALNTAKEMIDRELRAIDQGRLCRLPPYADYCEYVKLPRPKSFEDISSDPDVLNALRNAYGSVDEVEFYPGLFAEDLDSDSPLPPLMRTLVALDAFSQALTNPLLAEHIFNVDTFSRPGWDSIHTTTSLRDMVIRNTPQTPETRPIGMSFTKTHQAQVLPKPNPALQTGGEPTLAVMDGSGT